MFLNLPHCALSKARKKSAVCFRNFWRPLGTLPRGRAAQKRGAASFRSPVWLIFQKFFYMPSICSERYFTSSSSLMRTCFVVSRSRRVTVPSPSAVWKSTVIPNGVPISSCLRYLLPIAPAASKNTFQRRRSLAWSFCARSMSSGLFLTSGNTAALRARRAG